MPIAHYLLPDLINVPGGDFAMGSDSHGRNEAPVHRVWIDAFALAKYPVTRKEYALFVAATGHTPPTFWHELPFQHPEQPVAGPSWNDAVAYCTWLSEITGKTYRLPSEAEREKAARGGLKNSAYPWGDELPDDYKGGRDTPLDTIGHDGPNGYGFYDMSAGVHEWCADYYDKSYYANSPERNPLGPTSGTRRAARGGSWRHEVRFSRCAGRSSLAPDKQFSDFGFRCAL